MAKLDDILTEVRNQLGSIFVSTDVVGMDGISIAGGTTNPNFDGVATSALFTMVMKLASKVAGKIDAGEVEDALVTTDQSYILAGFLGDGSYYWVIVVTLDATLGVVRMLMNEYADQLWDAIPT